MIKVLYGVEVDTLSKQSVLNFMSTDIPIHTSGYFMRERNFKQQFPELYELCKSTQWKESLPFGQQLYHWFHDDYQLELRRCVICGANCKFHGFKHGYLTRHCCVRCVHSDPKVSEKRATTTQQRHGNANYRNVEKSQQTKLNNHGDRYYCNWKQGVATKYSKYNNRGMSMEAVERGMMKKRELYGEHLELIVEKQQTTDRANHNGLLSTQTQEHKDRVHETWKNKPEEEKKEIFRTSVESNVKNHNGVHANSTNDVIEKHRNTRIRNSGSLEESYKRCGEKCKKSNMNNLDVPWPMMSKECQEKSKQTSMVNFGVPFYSKSQEFHELWKNPEYVKTIVLKMNNTKRKNGTFNTSKIETQIANWLDEHGVNYIQQYRDPRYPFNCDFYFPESDLFVEIQGSWTHGGHPFNPDVDLTTVQLWLEKNSKFYDNAVDTWVIRDVKKRETARNNNLNYLEIFSCDIDVALALLYNYI